MAITIDRLPRKTKVSVDNNGRITRTHTEKFRIYSDAQIDQFTAGQALGLTGFSTPAYDPLALLKDFDCEDEAKTRAPWRYIATATYSTGNAPQQDDNPLNAPVEITVSTREEKRAILYDRDDNAILNLAGDWYDPAIEIPVSNTVMTFVRNEPSYDWSMAYGYVDHTNLSSFLGAEPDQIKCTRIAGTRKIQGQYVFWPVTYEFEHSRFGWQPRVLEQGRRQYKSGKRSAIFDEITKQPITDPVPIFQSGSDIIPVPAASLPTGAIFTIQNAFPQAEFSNIGLPV